MTGVVVAALLLGGCGSGTSPSASGETTPTTAPTTAAQDPGSGPSVDPTAAGSLAPAPGDVTKLCTILTRDDAASLEPDINDSTSELSWACGYGDIDHGPEVTLVNETGNLKGQTPAGYLEHVRTYESGTSPVQSVDGVGDHALFVCDDTAGSCSILWSQGSRVFELDSKPMRTEPGDLLTLAQQISQRLPG